MISIEELEQATAGPAGTDEEESEEDWEDQLEEDLCEAKELLEGVVQLMDGLLRTSWRRGRNRLTAMQEKEIEDMASEIAVFLDQWEKVETTTVPT